MKQWDVACWQGGKSYYQLSSIIVIESFIGNIEQLRTTKLAIWMLIYMLIIRLKLLLHCTWILWLSRAFWRVIQTNKKYHIGKNVLLINNRINARSVCYSSRWFCFAFLICAEHWLLKLYLDFVTNDRGVKLL
jgi:hypothetical protein